jgi:hypothetical protein
VKTAQNLQRSKAVRLTLSRAVRVKFFRGLETCAIWCRLPYNSFTFTQTQNETAPQRHLLGHGHSRSTCHNAYVKQQAVHQSVTRPAVTTPTNSRQRHHTLSGTSYHLDLKQHRFKSCNIHGSSGIHGLLRLFCFRIKAQCAPSKHKTIVFIERWKHK